MNPCFFYVLIILLCFANNVFAYVGPGVGLGVIGSIFGIFAAIFLAIIGVFWYPLKRLIKKFRNSDAETNASDETK